MADILSNLVARYQFNQVSGTNCPDSGSFNIAGTLNGSGGNLPEKVAGFNNKPNLGLEFERANSEKVVFPNIGGVFDINGDISFATWLKVNSWSVAWQCLFSKGEASYRLARDNSTNLLNFDVNPNAGVISSTEIQLGKWVHVAGTRRASDKRLRIYFNGVLDNENFPTQVMGTSVHDFTLGDNVGLDAGRFFDGVLQDFRLYTRTLSDDDVKALFDSYYGEAGDEFQKIIRSYSYGILNFKHYGVRNTVLNSTANFAEGKNLERVGRDRNLPRYQGEDVDEYRVRVRDAFRKNLGLGGVDDIISVMEGLGATTLGTQYLFNSFVSGDKGDSSEGLFNVLTKSLAGGAVCDGTFDCDGTLACDSPESNDIVFEIVQTPASISTAQETEIRNALDPIIRASSTILKIIRLSP